MEDDVIVTNAETEEVPDWPEQRGVKPTAPAALPPSSNKEFWGDSYHTETSAESLNQQRQYIREVMKKHTVRMQGQEFICTTCPHTHSIPLDPRKYTLDHQGNIVTIDNK